MHRAGRTLTAALALLLFGAIVPVTAPAETSPLTPACTKVGTEGDDFLAGTKRADTICGLGGKDYISGRRDNDVLLGGPHNDTLVADDGIDRLNGGPGKDQMFAVDGRGGDLLRGKGGFDRCYVDQGDRTKGCEVIRVSRTTTSTVIANGMSDALSRAITYGEFVQDCFTAVPACPLPNGKP